jgi:predicted dehydrogenase
MIRAAQIGLGWWGKTLVESVQGVSPDLQFVAAASRTQTDDYKAFCATHGLTFHQTYAQALADPQVDAVVLATPHSLHSPQVIAAAKAGKHVFCEKPFALTKADAAAAVAATQQAGVTHVAGASSEERRTRLFGTCKFQPIKGEAQVWEAARLDVTRACLDAFGQAAQGGPAFPIPLDQMVHGAAVTEAVVRSAASGQIERIQ